MRKGRNIDESAETTAERPLPCIPSRTRIYKTTGPDAQTKEDQGASKAAAETLEAAIDDWGETVLRLAASRLGNLADAEDVFQTVFLKLFQSSMRFRDAEHQKAWLLRVTMNCCNDIHRSSWCKRQAEFDDAMAATLAAPDECGNKGTDEELTSALKQLSEKQRTTVHLFYFEGYATDEIARITGESPATVRSHLHRARKVLRKELGAQQ